MRYAIDGPRTVMVHFGNAPDIIDYSSMLIDQGTGERETGQTSCKLDNGEIEEASRPHIFDSSVVSRWLHLPRRLSEDVVDL